MYTRSKQIKDAFILTIITNKIEALLYKKFYKI